MFFRPTYPNFFAFEAGNRTIFFFVLILYCNKMLPMLLWKLLYTKYIILYRDSVFRVHKTSTHFLAQKWDIWTPTQFSIDLTAT
jgi:hypothetical protein